MSVKVDTSLYLVTCLGISCGCLPVLHLGVKLRVGCIIWYWNKASSLPVTDGSLIDVMQQNNLSNPPTPPASLPPTPPPVACQKLVNGFATTEELAGKAGVLGGHDGKARLCWVCKVSPVGRKWQNNHRIS